MGVFGAIVGLLNADIEVGGPRKVGAAQKSSAKKKSGHGKGPHPSRENTPTKRSKSVTVIRTESQVPAFSRVVSLTNNHRIPPEEEGRVLLIPEDQTASFIVVELANDKMKTAGQNHPAKTPNQKPNRAPNSGAPATVVIIAAVDETNAQSSQNSAQINHNFNAYLMMQRKLQELHYKVGHRIFATREVIALLYHRHTELKSAKSASEDDEKLVNKFDKLLVEALVDNVSDIHIEAIGADLAQLKFRINGLLSLKETWLRDYSDKMTGVLYDVLGEEQDPTLDLTKPQSCVIKRTVNVPGRGKQNLRLRLNTLPAYPNAYNVILRVLTSDVVEIETTYNDLGYDELLNELIRKAMAKPQGAIVIAGTTGSGKSTTLTVMYTQLVHENMDARRETCTQKIITVEDPPEYAVPFVVQSPVVRSATKDSNMNPFAAAIAAAMRSDPDVLGISEVRDAHSAQLLVGAVGSGHKCFTTTHTSSALDVPQRLRSLGIEDSVLGGMNFFAALIYQTLVPTLCPHCKITYDEWYYYMQSIELSNFERQSFDQFLARMRRLFTAAEMKGVFFKNPHDKHFASKLASNPSDLSSTSINNFTVDCPYCKNTGIVDRTVCAEVIIPDTYMRTCFGKNQDNLALVHYLKNGGRLALDHGIDKVRMGICDPTFIEKKLGWLTESIDQRKDILGDSKGNGLLETSDNPSSVFPNPSPIPEPSMKLDYAALVASQPEVASQTALEPTPNVIAVHTPDDQSEQTAEDNHS